MNDQQNRPMAKIGKTVNTQITLIKKPSSQNAQKTDVVLSHTRNIRPIAKMSMMVSSNEKKANVTAEQTRSERIEMVANRLRASEEPMTSHPATTSHTIATSLGFEKNCA
jgi:hypothetical protein